MAAPVFEMENVTVRRNGKEILNDVSWSVEKGQHWVILGGNGSGKTSILNVLMGYLTPTEGEVEMKGREDAINSQNQEWDDWRKRIGFVSSSISQLIDLEETALDIVLAGRHAMVNYWGDNDEKEIRAAEKVLERVNCLELRDQMWATMSQGERQRVLIGRALMAPQMDMLILDEPYNGLDPVGRHQMTQLLIQLSEQGTSLLFASHVLHEIEEITSSFLLIHGGRLLASGTASEVEQIIADTPQEVVLIGPDVPKLIPHLADQAWVDSIQLLAERTELRIGLRDPSNLYHSVADWISNDQLQIDQFQTANSNLTAVFESLLRHHRGESK